MRNCAKQNATLKPWVSKATAAWWHIKLSKLGSISGLTRLFATLRLNMLLKCYNGSCCLLLMYNEWILKTWLDYSYPCHSSEEFSLRPSWDSRWDPLRKSSGLIMQIPAFHLRCNETAYLFYPCHKLQVSYCLKSLGPLLKVLTGSDCLYAAGGKTSGPFF